MNGGHGVINIRASDNEFSCPSNWASYVCILLFAAANREEALSAFDRVPRARVRSLLDEMSNGQG